MDKKYIIESLLFTAGHSLSYKKLAEVLSIDNEKISETEVEKLLRELADDYENHNRGLRLVYFDNKVQMATASDSVEVVKKLVKSDFEEELSSAALEVLSVIAYRGPLSRVEIENLRGVNCSFILQSLAIRGLIERKNNPQNGRSYIYNITFDFLKHLGLTKLEDLPNYNDLKNKV